MFNLVTTLFFLVLFWALLITQVLVPLFQGKRIFPIFRNKDKKLKLKDVDLKQEEIDYEKEYIVKYDSFLKEKYYVDRKKKILINADDEDYLV